MDFNKYPDEIAEQLYKLAYGENAEVDQQIMKDLENCLYDLKAVCENEYNFDFFRTMYRTLEQIEAGN